MTVKVADVRANLNENIRHAARIIGKSSDRRKVFAAIYQGKKQIKTVPDICTVTHLTEVRVLQEAGKLAGNGIVEKIKIDGRLAYKKDEVYAHHKNRVLDLVRHPSKAAKYPTKQEPRSSGSTTVRITLAKSRPLPKEVTVDDIDSFSKVKNVQALGSHRLDQVPESRIKHFLQRVIGERFEFKDWGGERNDLYTTRLRFQGKRCRAAFALKGRGTKGTLTPKKMGKNGDQIGRLFSSDADAYFVVYHSKIDQAIQEQLRAYAVAKALSGLRVYYCAIDGADLARLVTAYAGDFSAAGRK